MIKVQIGYKQTTGYIMHARMIKKMRRQKTKPTVWNSLAKIQVFPKLLESDIRQGMVDGWLEH